jgi:predicted neuraminidase
MISAAVCGGMEKTMKKEWIELNTLTSDGRLYHNNLLDTIEALIPNPFVSSHAADLLELPNGDILCCWFAGSDEGNADISIVMSRLNADSKQWTVHSNQPNCFSR